MGPCTILIGFFSGMFGGSIAAFVVGRKLAAGTDECVSLFSFFPAVVGLIMVILVMTS